jgi:hypothetical protein
MPKDTKGIFISYRREDTVAYAGWLGDKLSERFGSDKVFRDVDSVDLGLDFVEAIQRAVDSCDVLIAVIGRSWQTATDQSGAQRLKNPNDYVRMEISAALKRNVRVVPVLVQGASMPSADELPNDLAALARRNAFEMHDTSWGADLQRLVTGLERVVGNNGAQTNRGQDSPRHDTSWRDKVKRPVTGQETVTRSNGAERSRGQDSQSPSVYEKLKKVDKAADVWARYLVLAIVGLIVLFVIIGALFTQ